MEWVTLLVGQRETKRLAREHRLHRREDFLGRCFDHSPHGDRIRRVVQEFSSKTLALLGLRKSSFHPQVSERGLHELRRNAGFVGC